MRWSITTGDRFVGSSSFSTKARKIGKGARAFQLRCDCVIECKIKKLIALTKERRWADIVPCWRHQSQHWRRSSDPWNVGETATYRIWHHVVRQKRCTNPNDAKQQRDHGGRGIEAQGAMARFRKFPCIDGRAPEAPQHVDHAHRQRRQPCSGKHGVGAQTPLQIQNRRKPSQLQKSRMSSQSIPRRRSGCLGNTGGRGSPSKMRQGFRQIRLASSKSRSMCRLRLRRRSRVAIGGSS